MEIKALRTHGKTSSHIKKVEVNKSKSSLSKPFEASASNKVLHQQTFTIPSCQVKKTEILLSLHSILTHTTQVAMEKYVKLKKVLFPDSKISEQLELGRTKLVYLPQFSFVPYFKKQLFSSLLPVTGFAAKFVSCFDEAFNLMSKQKQMYVYDFYFHEEKQKVVRSYIGSHFLGYVNAKETFQSIQAAHGRLDLTQNLVQVSMDSRNVHWKQ